MSDGDSSLLPHSVPSPTGYKAFSITHALNHNSHLRVCNPSPPPHSSPTVPPLVTSPHLRQGHSYFLASPQLLWCFPTCTLSTCIHALRPASKRGMSSAHFSPPPLTSAGVVLTPGYCSPFPSPSHSQKQLLESYGWLKANCHPHLSASLYQHPHHLHMPLLHLWHMPPPSGPHFQNMHIWSNVETRTLTVLTTCTRTLYQMAQSKVRSPTLM